MNSGLLFTAHMLEHKDLLVPFLHSGCVLLSWFVGASETSPIAVESEWKVMGNREICV